jgi:hypothetical protein
LDEGQEAQWIARSIMYPHNLLPVDVRATGRQLDSRTRHN